MLFSIPIINLFCCSGDNNNPYPPATPPVKNTSPVLSKENDEWVMWDWKTGNNIQKAPLQMVAYMRAAEKLHKIKIKKGYIGWMPSRKPNKKGYRIIEVENSDVLFELFASIKKMFDHEHGKETPKYKAYPMDISLKYIQNNEIMKEV